jgi:hypothetical protein
MRRAFMLVSLLIPAVVGCTGRAPVPAAATAPAPAVAGATDAMPAPAGLIANIEHRSTMSLNGPWHFIVDPYETGYYDYRHQPRKDGYFLRAVPKTPRDLVEYDFEKSGTLQVPGDWNSQNPELFYYEGALWYERSFTYRRPSDRRVFRARRRLHGLQLRGDQPREGRGQLRRDDGQQRPPPGRGAYGHHGLVELRRADARC